MAVCALDGRRPAFGVFGSVAGNTKPGGCVEVVKGAGESDFHRRRGRLSMAVGTNLPRRFERLLWLRRVVADFALTGNPRVGRMRKLHRPHARALQRDWLGGRLLPPCDNAGHGQ